MKKPYIVRVRVIGEWWAEHEVQAENSSDARNNWNDENVSEKLNDEPIGLDALEWEVYNVKPDFYEDEYNE